MTKIKFRPSDRDPFTDFRINMEIICNLEEGGKIGEEEAFEQARFRSYIQSKNDQVTVEIVNDSIDQSKFIAMEWTGLYFDVARKYG